MSTFHDLISLNNGKYFSHSFIKLKNLSDDGKMIQFSTDEKMNTCKLLQLKSFPLDYCSTFSGLAPWC
jgi:hypothetical protein